MAVEDINIIDAIAEDTRTGEIVLLMREPRTWEHGDRQLFQLQEKLNTYLSFALDGEMAEEHPEWADRPLRVRLECAAPPDARAELMLSAVRGQISFQGIKLDVRVLAADYPPSSTFQ